jgi:uncharacterized membrane protein
MKEKDAYEGGKSGFEAGDEGSLDAQPAPVTTPPGPVDTPPPGDLPVVLAVPKEAGQTIAASEAQPKRAREEKRVTVAPNLLDLVTGVAATPEEEHAAREKRNLEALIHKVVSFGLVLSVVLLLTGLLLDLVLQRDVPTAVPEFSEVMERVFQLRPSGFLALGLLVLIATPILRVIGSVIAFLYEGDWRYAGITFLVLCIVILSVIFGKR